MIPVREPRTIVVPAWLGAIVAVVVVFLISFLLGSGLLFWAAQIGRLLR